MKIIISFDHELFFGERSGTPEKCLIEPSEALMAAARPFAAPLSFFVDAGYLVALRRHAASHSVVARHYELVRRHLDRLVAEGHELALHVHPHWEDARWTDAGWHFDLSRFALRNFPEVEVIDLFSRYADELRPHVPDGQIHAYRGGGWAIYPFPPIGRALRSTGIRIDSTVYAGGKDTTGNDYYDFTGAPDKTAWRFNDDPAQESVNGDLIEVPVSSMRVSPAYYWSQAIGKFGASSTRKVFGDGQVRPSRGLSGMVDKLTKLAFPSRYCVTLDGNKSSLLLKAYERSHSSDREFFVALSHPKALINDSLLALEKLLQLAKQREDEVVSYKHITHLFVL